MKLQRSVIWGNYASYSTIEIGNSLDRDQYITLVECDGGIIGEFIGWSKLGKSNIHIIYKKIPSDDIDEEDECEKGGCYVGSLHLPSKDEIEKGATKFHTIPLLKKDNRPPTKLVVRIAPQDFISIDTDQREVYKLIDDNGDEIPLEDLLGGKHSS